MQLLTFLNLVINSAFLKYSQTHPNLRLMLVEFIYSLVTLNEKFLKTIWCARHQLLEASLLDSHRDCPLHPTGGLHPQTSARIRTTF